MIRQILDFAALQVQPRRARDRFAVGAAKLCSSTNLRNARFLSCSAYCTVYYCSIGWAAILPLSMSPTVAIAQYRLPKLNVSYDTEYIKLRLIFLRTEMSSILGRHTSHRCLDKHTNVSLVDQHGVIIRT